MKVEELFNKFLFTGTVGANFLWHLKKDQWKTLNELRYIQLKNLKAMVNYAYNYVSYYHNLFNSVNLKPEDIIRLNHTKYKEN